EAEAGHAALGEVEPLLARRREPVEVPLRVAARVVERDELVARAGEPPPDRQRPVGRDVTQREQGDATAAVLQVQKRRVGTIPNVDVGRLRLQGGAQDGQERQQGGGGAVGETVWGHREEGRTTVGTVVAGDGCSGAYPAHAHWHPRRPERPRSPAGRGRFEGRVTRG